MGNLLVNAGYDPALVRSVKDLHKTFEGNLIFCGSLGLKIQGLLDREIQDIDVLTETNYYGDVDIPGYSEQSSARFHVQGIEVMCFKMVCDKYTADVMYRPDYHKLKRIGVNFYGLYIEVHDGVESLQVKRNYVASLALLDKDKHWRDIQTIESKIGTVNKKPSIREQVKERLNQDLEHYQQLMDIADNLDNGIDILPF